MAKSTGVALAFFGLALAACGDGDPAGEPERLSLGLVVEAATHVTAVETVAPAAGMRFALFTVTIGNKGAAPFALADAMLTAETAAQPMAMADVSTLLADGCRDEMVLAADGQVTCRFVVEAPAAAKIARVRLTANDGRSVEAQVPALP